MRCAPLPVLLTDTVLPLLPSRPAGTEDPGVMAT